MTDKSKRTFLSLHLVHWLILIVSLALTFGIWLFTAYQTEQMNQAKFEREAKQVVSLIRERMQKYVDTLHAGVAFINADKEPLTPEKWRVFATSLKIEKKYPGINGIGVIYAVKKSDEAAFLAKQRALGNHFKIYPAHDGELLLPIAYIEPLSINKQAHGLDVAHEENRFTAAMTAATSRQPAVTGPIVLVQDAKKTAGFLLYVPFYEHKQLIGYVYAPFIVHKLMDGVLSQDRRYVYVNIQDAGEDIFRDEEMMSRDQPTNYVKDVTVNLYGRSWDIHIEATPGFIRLLHTDLPTYILIAACIIDITLLTVFILLARSRKRAIVYAEELTEELQRQANEDYLTSLPNRMAFIESLETVTHGGEHLDIAILYLDLDDFKTINDTLGHHIGDELLIAVAARLRDLLEDIDNANVSVARLGGDEFAILMVGIDIVDSVEKLATEIIKKMSYSFEVEGHKLFIRFSIGAAVNSFGEIEKEQVKTLLKYADIAMYDAKHKGKNQFSFFSDDMLESIERGHLIEISMYQALEDKQFKMAYQSIIGGQDFAEKGVEALLRWHHPELGDVNPMELIPIAEKTRFIIDLGYYILESIFEQVTVWRKDNNPRANGLLCINSSVIQLEDPDFPERVNALMSAYAIDPSLVVLELTETALMTHIESKINMLETLHKLGVSLAIDDFGTGYSSLNYLEQLPVDYLKIDRSFVSRMLEDSDSEMVKNIITIAQASSLRIIAEGVETEAQAQALKSLGCDYLQGYYFGKPAIPKA